MNASEITKLRELWEKRQESEDDWKEYAYRLSLAFPSILKQLEAAERLVKALSGTHLPRRASQYWDDDEKRNWEYAGQEWREFIRRHLSDYDKAVGG